MYFISGYKLTQKLLADKWKPSQKEDLHSFWLENILEKWQDYIEHYYSSRIKTFSIDQFTEVGAQQSLIGYNFKTLLYSNISDNHIGYGWSIDDDRMQKIFETLLTDKNYQAREEINNIQSEFKFIVDEYTEDQLLNDYHKIKGGPR